MIKEILQIGWRRWAVVGALTLTGCNNPTSNYDANVQGTVTIDGELAHGGTVTFSPKEKGPVATGIVAADGSFALKIGQGTTAEPNRSLIPAGDYVATVVVNGPPVTNPDEEAGGPPHTGPRLMADKYADKDTSGLEFTVKKGTNVFDLKLDGPSANPPVEEAAEADAEPAESGEEPKSDAGATEVPADGPAPAEPASVDSIPTPEEAAAADGKAPPPSEESAPESSSPSDASTQEPNS